MIDNDTSRLSRVIRIFTYLQSKKLITAAFLAEKFGVSVRTIYRDVKMEEIAVYEVKDGKIIREQFFF